MTEDMKDQELGENSSQDKEARVDSSVEDLKRLDGGGENAVPSLQQEEEVIKKKYGGLLPKKPPLISKDHEHAFFDSADWALGKQGTGKPKGPLEALRPKLQPTPHQHVRRSAYAPTDDHDEDGDHGDCQEDQICRPDESSSTSIITSEESNCQEKVERC